MWKDIDIELNMKVNGDIQDKINNQAIENSISNIFKTMPGSRRMLYDFSSSVYNMLFEQIDDITAERIGYSLLSNIEQWETRIVVLNLNVEPREDDNMYVITLSYNIINDGLGDDISYVYKTILKAV